MKTHDPFLRHLANALDRVMVWLALDVVLTALAWTAAYERGLGVPALDMVRALLALDMQRPIDRISLTVLLMSAVIGTLGATLLSGVLFRRWKRKASPEGPLRGTRWESEE